MAINGSHIGLTCIRCTGQRQEKSFAQQRLRKMSIRAIVGVLAIALCLQSLPNGSAYRKPHITPEYDLDVVSS